MDCQYELPSPSVLMQELYQQILPLESLGLGLPTGVQTITTPTLTLTPTTLRSFAAVAGELLDEEQRTYHNEAGFVPPVVHAASSTYMVDSKAWQGGSVTTMPAVTAPPPAAAAPTPASVPSVATIPTTTHATVSQPPPSVSPPTSSSTTSTRKNVGGRRPNKAKGISPEEEERRQVRRERNKAAAARCRKRRMDHTNSLIKETEGLEQKKQGLQLDIQELKRELEELSYLLETHICRLPRPDRNASPLDVKPSLLELKQEPASTLEPPAKRAMLSMAAMPAPAPGNPLGAPAPPSQTTKPLRPTSLPVSSHTMLRSSAAEIAGISISTPSTGVPLNFESLMDGGTGLTPVSGPLVPSCSSQQRNQNCVDLSSPDSNISNKLVSL